MHGLVAGLWSSLSGAGRFVSRAGSGLLVDAIGFDRTAAITFGLQIAVAAATFYYVICFELRCKKIQRSVRWDDVTIIEEGSQDETVVFTESNSPSESVMGSRSVYVEIPRQHQTPNSARRGLLSRSGGANYGSISSHSRSLPHRRYSRLTSTHHQQLYSPLQMARSVEH